MQASDPGSAEAATPAPHAPGATRAIGLWLWCVAALVFAMVLVGGATRLTESGLSIVEWKPVTGAIPPLGEADWQAEFAKYKTIPQYERLNRGMSLDEFKTIYWWEWGHRLLGRLIGAAFLLPFLWFLWRRCDRPPARARARRHLRARRRAGRGRLVDGGIGARRAGERVAIPPRIPPHACLHHLCGACLDGRSHIAQRRHASAGAAAAVPRRLRWSACALLVLVIAQIYLGALVAGLRAGLIYNTWPLIDGSLIPSAANLFFDQPLWRNFFENTLTVQFDHRMVAYGLCVLALIHAVDAHRNGRNDHARHRRRFRGRRAPRAGRLSGS